MNTEKALDLFLPLAAILEAAVTAKASRGQYVGQTGLDLINARNEGLRRNEASREKALDRAARQAERKEDSARLDKQLGFQEASAKAEGGLKEAEFMSKDDKEHRTLVDREKAVARMLGVEGTPATTDEATNTITMGQKAKPGLPNLSDVDKEFIRQDPIEWLKRQVAQQKEFAPPRPTGSGGGGKPPPAPKPLPTGAIQDLAERSSAADIFSGLRSDFKPEFAGYKTQIGGDAANWAKRTYGDKSGQAQWWQTYQEQKNVVRHKFFGSALTATEKGEFDKAQINPAMDPEQISLNLQRQEAAIRSAAVKLEKAYQASGYKTPGLAEKVDESLLNPKAAETTGAPKFGDTKLNKQGAKVRWNGTGWELAE